MYNADIKVLHSQYSTSRFNSMKKKKKKPVGLVSGI